MAKSSLLSRKPMEQLKYFVYKNRNILGVPEQKMYSLCRAAVSSSPLDIRPRIERRWYGSLARGTPDYSVYGGWQYIPEAWACWAIYSRKYLLGIQNPGSMVDRSIVDDLGQVKSVVDVGCGLGLTTAALSQVFPSASVCGTNIVDSLQMKICKNIATDYDFKMHGTTPTGRVDLLWATEYFEHINSPIVELVDIVEKLNPRAMLIANTFTSPAIGHFKTYLIDGDSVPGKASSLLFNKKLRAMGYVKIKTKLWNNRPAYWRKNR